jgi:hypothetical protein
MTALVLALGLLAQKDFLTADEADQIRLAQDPNIRLRVYAHFAKQRVDLIEQALKKPKAGNSALIHEYLDEYTKIVEAIDVVTDDALRRRVAIDEGMLAVIQSEKEMLAALKRVAEKKSPDAARYEFSLAQAIETTEDSIEAALQDADTRRAEAAQAADRLRKEREELLKPVEGEGKAVVKPESERKAEAAAAEAEKKPARKAPTLRKKGEPVPAAKP